mmetsp:Transcript_88318/g.152922  ORF Transcript_88318/g.152922 Transcript_88318/m.152922 type:complete len:232 (-) Transcript_88318:736-1431(-)
MLDRCHRSTCHDSNVGYTLRVLGHIIDRRGPMSGNRHKPFRAFDFTDAAAPDARPLQLLKILPESVLGTVCGVEPAAAPTRKIDHYILHVAAASEVLVAAVQLCIGLLDQRRPSKCRPEFSFHGKGLTFVLFHGQVIINGNLDPLAIFVEPQDKVGFRGIRKGHVGKDFPNQLILRAHSKESLHEVFVLQTPLVDAAHARIYESSLRADHRVRRARLQVVKSHPFWRQGKI